jgi:succinyl-CoA synthetase alpha subunit
MTTGVTIRKNEYYDSVFLMGINNRIMKENGVIQSAVLMGSDSNKEVLKELGFSDPKIDHASANDLVVGVISSSQEVIDSILNNLSAWLTEVRVQKSDTAIHSLKEAVDQNPEANLVSISVPGEFAGNEARKSLEAGLNVFLFSDNVSVEDELSLKQYARTKDLLVMGPDCGTSIIGGIGLGFSNAVRRGPIGVIAAAGTGLQEFTCMVHNAGYGISHAIGTGGRDLSDAIGGLTTLSALDVLEQEKNTQVIVILSKPPGKNTLTKLVKRFTTIDKPIIGCFIGIEDTIEGEGTLFKRAKIIDEAVELAIKQVGGNLPTGNSNVVDSQNLKRKYLPGQKYLRGVFAGGTFCFQAQQLLKSAGIKVYSNSPIDRAFKLKHPDNSIENSIVDMGDEYYMVGRPHPMIDGSQRALRILKEARDPEVAVILLDFILGYNASRDPVGELAEAIQEAGKFADKQGDRKSVV